MSDIDPDKLKVAELRDELKARGLDTKGNKAALIARLKSALDSNEDQPNSGQLATGGSGNGEEGQTKDDAEDAEDAEDEEEESAQYDEDAQLIDESTNDITNLEDPGKQDVEPAEVGDETTEGKEEANVQETNGNVEEEEPAIILGDEFRTIDEATQDDTEEGNVDRKRKRSRSRDRHRLSRSRDRHGRDRRYGRSSPPPRKVEMDDTAWESLTTFTLDRYDADLNLRFNDRGIKAYPLTVDGFAYMWSGVRANYGVRSGKVAYEVKVLENLNVEHLPRDEVDAHVVRVGWSVNSVSLHLGEEALSYGYGGNGKAATECNFVDYGQKFGVGDVITCYADFENDPVILSFSKNGEDLGKCFEIEKEKLGDQALFPHFFTKNAEFECNFGGREGPYFPLKDGFKFLEEIPAEERIRGHLPPKTKEECEVIMTVGLPGAGKSYWAQKHIEAHPEKRYNLLGTNSIIDQMRVMGKPRKQNHTGKWEVLVEKANKCLTRFIELAARRKRNYIIDQTNVYASSRRRKMQPFEGFQRKAVVVLPTDEVFKNRVKERTEEGKDIPESAVNEMKANFSLPEEGQCFETIEYIEEGLNKEERDKLVEQYRKEGKDALPPPEKRSRPESREPRERRGGYRGGYGRERRSGYKGNNWKPYNERRGGFRGSYRGDRYYDDGRDSYGYKGSRGYGGYRGRSSWRGYGSRGGYGHSEWDSFDDDWEDYGPSYRDSWSGYSRGWSSYR